MEETFLFDLTILFGSAVVVSYVFRAVHLSTITGFLVAGMLIGPSGLSLMPPPRRFARSKKSA